MKIIGSTITGAQTYVCVSTVYNDKEIDFIVKADANGIVVGNYKSGMETSYHPYFNETSAENKKAHFKFIKDYVEKKMKPTMNLDVYEKETIIDVEFKSMDKHFKWSGTPSQLYSALKAEQLMNNFNKQTAEKNNRSDA